MLSTETFEILPNIVPQTCIMSSVARLHCRTAVNSAQYVIPVENTFSQLCITTTKIIYMFIWCVFSLYLFISFKITDFLY